MPTRLAPPPSAISAQPPVHRGSSYCEIWYPLGQVGVDVVLARENAVGADLAVQGHARHHRQLDGALVDDRQRSGLRRADRADMLVGRDLEVLGGAAAEQLGGGLQLDVHLHADHRFVLPDAAHEPGASEEGAVTSFPSARS